MCEMCPLIFQSPNYLSSRKGRCCFIKKKEMSGLVSLQLHKAAVMSKAPSQAAPFSSQRSSTCRWEHISSQSWNSFRIPSVSSGITLAQVIRGEVESSQLAVGCSPWCTPACLGKTGPAGWQTFLLNILTGSMNLCGFCGMETAYNLC